jgi:hypothetical protein
MSTQLRRYIRGLPEGTCILFYSPTEFGNKRYYPEQATGPYFAPAWEPFLNGKREPINFKTYPEAKAFLEKECGDPQVKEIGDHLRTSKVITFVQGEIHP